MKWKFEIVHDNTQSTYRLNTTAWNVYTNRLICKYRFKTLFRTVRRIYKKKCYQSIYHDKLSLTSLITKVQNSKTTKQSPRLLESLHQLRNSLMRKIKNNFTIYKLKYLLHFYLRIYRHISSNQSTTVHNQHLSSFPAALSMPELQKVNECKQIFFKINFANNQ